MCCFHCKQEKDPNGNLCGNEFRGQPFHDRCLTEFLNHLAYAMATLGMEDKRENDNGQDTPSA